MVQKPLPSLDMCFLHPHTLTSTLGSSPITRIKAQCNPAWEVLGLLTEQKDNTEEVAGLGQYSQAGARGVHMGLNSEGVGPRGVEH